MKKKILLVSLAIAVLACLFVISVGATEINYNETATLADGAILPIYDENQNPLIWYVSGTKEDGGNIYTSIPSNRNAKNDNNEAYVTYNINSTYGKEQLHDINIHIYDEAQGKYVSKNENNLAIVVLNLRGVNFKNIGDVGQKNIQYIYFPSTAIGCSKLFQGQGALRLIDFSLCDSYESFDEQNFKGCSNLHTVRLAPGGSYSLTCKNGNLFLNCSSLTSIYIPDCVTEIGSSTFQNCSSLTEINLPEGLISIGSNAFRNCRMKYIKLPSTLETLGAEALRDNPALEYVDFNNCKVTGSLGNYMFYSNTGLKAVTFSDGITSFGTTNGGGAFRGCDALEVVYLPSNVEEISTFNNKSKLYFVNEKFTLNWYDGIFDTEDWDGQKPSKPSIYYMPSTLKNFSEIFNSCHALNDLIVFPASITVIEHQYTFYNLNGKSFAFLGEVTSFKQNSNKTANYYFLNDNVTADTLTITGNQKGNFYYHSSGTHLCQKATVTAPTCIANEKTASICFCGDDMGTVETPETALGHEYNLANGATESHIAYTNYLAEGVLYIKCARCSECDDSIKTSPVITGFKGYSTKENGNGITFGYSVNLDALDEYKRVNGTALEFGFVLAVKAFVNGDAPLKADGTVADVTQGSVVKAVISNQALSYSGADFKLTGESWDGSVNINGVETALKELEFYMAGYIYDGNKVSYIASSTETTDTVGTVTYSQY